MITKNRIMEYLDSKGISPSFVEKQLNWGKGSLIKPKSISSDRLEEFIRQYSDINPTWLLTGEGNMLLDKNKNINIINPAKSTEKIIDDQYVNFLNIEPTLGLKAQIATNERIIGRINIPNMPKCDGAMRAVGYSMYPIIQSGDIVGFKMINDFANVHFGNIYVIAYIEEGDEIIAIKFIHEGSDENHIKLVSQNKDHSPVEIDKSTITAIALVKFNIRMFEMK